MMRSVDRKILAKDFDGIFEAEEKEKLLPS